MTRAVLRWFADLSDDRFGWQVIRDHLTSRHRSRGGDR